MPFTFLQWWEFLSYVVTVIGLPFAILVFIWQERKERRNEEAEISQRLSEAYADFLKSVLLNADLQLTSKVSRRADLSDDQIERRAILFEMVVALFEQAYILVYEEAMSKQTARLWQSWEDYMRHWCRREDFRTMLPRLLEGEDPDFQRHISRIAGEEAVRAAQS
jgi:hypothetical protein